MESAQPIVSPSLEIIAESASIPVPPTSTAPARQYPCRTCQKPFSSSSNRIRHERQIHAVANAATAMNCLFCDRVCFGQRALQLHAQGCRGVARAAAVEEVSSSAPLTAAIHRITHEPQQRQLSSTSHAESPVEVSDSDFNFDSGVESNSSESDSTSTISSGRSPPLFIRDAVADGLTHDFLLWLGQGPETVIEQTVKGRRMTTEKQLMPIRLNLRFLLNAVGSSGSPSHPVADRVSLSTLVEVDSIKAIMAQLEQRRVGPARIYALSLLLKKVCVYLCSRQSSASMLYISPQTLPSWQLIDSYCNQSSRKRKLRQRDRLVLHTSQATMTAEELTTVVRGCLSVLDDVMRKKEETGTLGLLKSDAKRFTEYFITVCFALLLAPRQQVFRAMTMESLERPQDGITSTYIIRLSAERTKVGHPVLLRVPDVLTAKLDFYLSSILPAGHIGHVFLQRSGEPRQDFSSATRAVTKQFIGRAVNAHQFRHCITTLFHGRKDTSDLMMRQLAETMNHDRETQVQFYVHQERLEAQERMQRMLMEQVRA